MGESEDTHRFSTMEGVGIPNPQAVQTLTVVPLHKNMLNIEALLLRAVESEFS